MKKKIKIAAKNLDGVMWTIFSTKIQPSEKLSAKESSGK
jgi:hypothetical protein